MNRIYHPWWKWECYRAGFFRRTPPDGMTRDDALMAYRDFLSSPQRFKDSIAVVFRDWQFSCEHWLSNEQINRVAWIGQAAMCAATSVPACFRGGFAMLSTQAMRVANNVAATALRGWLKGAVHDEQKGGPVHQDLDGSRIRGRYPRRSPRRIDGAASSPVIQGDLFGDPSE